MNQPTPHTPSNEPARIVTPEEAHGLARAMEPLPPIFGDLAYTVATEPDRTRAAVASELRSQAKRLKSYMCDAAQELYERADAIENGAPFDV